MSAGPPTLAARRRAGISMIEMVTVIVVTGILSVGLAGLMRHPVQGHAAVARRAELVDLAELAANRMRRDLRRALPNSVRVSDDGRAVELLHVVAGARYRAEPGINPNARDHTAASDWLGFGGDTRFNVLGRIGGLASSYGVPLAAGTRIAIYPTGSELWSDAAANTSPGILTASTQSIVVGDDGDEDQITLSASHVFPRTSPQGRLFLVDGPISYVCDPATGVLWRIDRYAVAASQPTLLASVPLSGGAAARVAEQVERCAFSYVPGTPARSGVVTLEITVEEDGERVRLLHQVSIPNAP